MNAPTVALTVPFLTSDSRQHVFQEKPLLSMYEGCATPPILVPHREHSRICLLYSCVGPALLWNWNAT